MARRGREVDVQTTRCDRVPDAGVSMDFQLHFCPDPAVVAAARQCELDVFLDAYGNTPDEWAAEYGPYEAQSLFMAVTEPGGDAVAVCRFVLPGAAGLKTLNDVARPPWTVDGARCARAAGISTADTWDVATVAVRSGAARAGLLAAALYRGLYLATRANNVRWITMIMDIRARRSLSMIGLATNVLPGTGTAPYLGSARSTPLWSDVAVMVDRQRMVNPDAHRLVTLGGGLGDVSVPPERDFVVATAPARDQVSTDQPTNARLCLTHASISSRGTGGL